MYPLISLLIIIIGIFLFVYVKKARKNSILASCAKIAGVILIAAGLLMLIFLMSGKLVLPLSNS